MIIYLLIIVLVNHINITKADESEETKYLNTLPSSVKKTLLDRVARRILNEVPEVNVDDSDSNGDALAGKLEEQSEFVKRILKQEVESLKSKRKYFKSVTKFRKSGDSKELSPDKNETEIETVAKKSDTDRMVHIDLTLRSGRSKRGNSDKDEVATTGGDAKYNEHENRLSFVPVKVKLDNKNYKRPEDNHVKETQILTTKSDSGEDIQIRGIVKKKVVDLVNTLDVSTKSLDNVNEITTQSYVDSESPSKSETVHFDRRSEDLELNRSEVFEIGTTEEVTPIPINLNTNLDNVKVTEILTLKPDKKSEGGVDDLITTGGDAKYDDHNNHVSFVPVKIKLDSENDKKPTEDNHVTETQILSATKESGEGIQIRASVKKEMVDSVNTSDVSTKTLDNVDKPTSHSDIDSESPSISETVSPIMYFGRRSEDLEPSKSEVFEISTTEEITPIPFNLNTNIDDLTITEIITLKPDKEGDSGKDDLITTGGDTKYDDRNNHVSFVPVKIKLDSENDKRPIEDNHVNETQILSAKKEPGEDILSRGSVKKEMVDLVNTPDVSTKTLDNDEKLTTQSYVNGESLTKSETVHVDRRSQDLEQKNSEAFEISTTEEVTPISINLNTNLDNVKITEIITVKPEKKGDSSMDDVITTGAKMEPGEDIQIGGSVKKETVDLVNTSNVSTENFVNVDEGTTHSYVDGESPSKSETIHLGRRSEDLELNKSEVFEISTTEDVNTVLVSFNTKLDDIGTTEIITLKPEIVDTTVADNKANTQKTEDEKNVKDQASKYSSESYLENPIIDSKGRKSLDNSDEKSTQNKETILENHVSDSSSSFSEDSLKISTTTSYLTTTDTLYMATTEINTVSSQKVIETATKADTDLKSEDMKLTTEENKENEDKTLILPQLIANISEINASINVEIIKTIEVNVNDTKVTDKKPCNETVPKVNEITDCDKKRKAENSTANEVNKTQSVPNEVKVEAGQNEVKTEAAVVTLPETKGLRTSKTKPVHDSFIHFGDLQIKKEYEVYEVESGRPVFVKQIQRDENEKTSVEQPQFAPVYNYDPKNAYFNAYNRLGPNENDDEDSNSADDRSESLPLENENILRTKSKKGKLRMSKIPKHHKGKLHRIKVNPEATTTAYYSKEACCDYISEDKYKTDDEMIVLPESDEVGHISNPYVKVHLNGVRQAYFNHKLFGYVPDHHERKQRLVQKTKYLYNNILGKSTEEILDESKENIKQVLRTSGDGKSEDRNDASEDNTEIDKNKSRRDDSKEGKGLEIVVIDLNENSSPVGIQRSSKKFRLDEEAKTLFEGSKEYDLTDIVPYHAVNTHIINQKGEAKMIYDRIMNMAKKTNDNDSAEVVKLNAEDIQPTVDKLKNMDLSKTLFKQAHIDAMVKVIEDMAKEEEKTPRHVQYLKQGLTNLRQQDVGPQNGNIILRTNNCDPSSTCVHALMGANRLKKKSKKSKKSKGYEAPNTVLDSIKKINEITPEVDMYQNVEKMLKIDGLSIARSRDDDLGLHVKILKDMVKMDNSALEEYDWLATTVSVQSALAKLKEIIDAQKNDQYIHPADMNLLKYAVELYDKARQITKEKEGETLDEYLEDIGYTKDEIDKGRSSLPKTHRKIKNPLQILLQRNELMNKKVFRKRIDEKMENFEVFLNCVLFCLDDFHTAIREISTITKYNKQRWYRNIKDLYLTAGEEKEYLEVLLHLFSMKLFRLIDDSAQNGAEDDYKAYFEKNRFEVDRSEAEIMFIVRIVKALHELKRN